MGAAAGQDDPGEQRGHDGLVGEPAERTLGHGGSELEPRGEPGGGLVEVRRGEDVVGRGEGGAPQGGIIGRPKPPPPTPDPGATAGFGLEQGCPGGELFAAGLAGQMQ